MTRAPSHTLVFDGNCRLCQRAVRAVRALDRDGVIETLPSQTPGIRERFPFIAADRFESAMQLVRPGNAHWEGAAAVEEILRILPRSRWASPLFGLPLVRPLVDAVYKWIARNRHHLGCGRHCKNL